MESIDRWRSPQWFWIALIWSGVGLFDATQTVFAMHAEGMHHAWIRLFLTLFLSWLPWALATPAVVQLSRKYPPGKTTPISAWLLHLGASISIGLISAALTAGLELLLDPWAISSPPSPFFALLFKKFYNGLLSYLILYAFIVAISYVLETESARLNEQLSKAQLDALRRQIEPHFLFNTLNSIAGLVREKRNDDAVNMIVRLSDFLRRVVEDSNRQNAPLGEEIEFLQKYLDIQKVRFAERLQVSVNVPKELLPALIPSLILQPMVENAVKHGIAKRAQGGMIRIAAVRSNGMLNLSVFNDGPNLPAGWDESCSGIGISNVRTRLQGLYGNRFELSIRNQEPSGVEVSVSVPFVSRLSTDR
jgi:sensor histidine kinase YesM